MASIVEATIPAEGFVLSDALSHEKTVTFRAVRLVAHERGRVIPFMRVDCDAIDRLYRVIQDDPTVRDFTLLEAFSDGCLISIDWEPRVRDSLSVLDTDGVLVLNLSGYDGKWHLQMYVSERDVLLATKEFFEDEEIDISFNSINQLSPASESGYFGLSDCQYETVLTAYEQGYYDVPRTVTQTDLAANFGISHQALSERLRRAHGTLITTVLYHAVYRCDHTISPGMLAGSDF